MSQDQIAVAVLVFVAALCGVMIGVMIAWRSNQREHAAHFKSGYFAGWERGHQVGYDYRDQGLERPWLLGFADDGSPVWHRTRPQRGVAPEHIFEDGEQA